MEHQFLNLVALWYRSMHPNGQTGHVHVTYLSPGDAPGVSNLVQHVASMSVYNLEGFGSDRTKNRFLAIFSKSSKCTPLTEKLVLALASGPVESIRYVWS